MVNFVLMMSACQYDYLSMEQIQVKDIFSLLTPEVHICPEGKEYFDCRFPDPELPAGGVNCETTCANLAMNFTCAPSSPCISGCVCAPG